MNVTNLMKLSESKKNYKLKSKDSNSDLKLPGVKML